MMRNGDSGRSGCHFSYEEVGQLVRLIQESRAAEVRIELEDLKLHVVRDSSAAISTAGGSTPATATAPPPSPAPSAEVAEAAPPAPEPVAPATDATAGAHGAEDGQPAPGPPGCVPITAPMVGVFYSAPAPDEPPFVEEGATVEPGDQVAIIEVMKLMNEIQSEIGGVVMRVDATNGELVQYGEPLMWVEPDRDGKAV
jgi:acetyl-CoA carboxylase biotin carboxyl carrier protein